MMIFYITTSDNKRYTIVAKTLIKAIEQTQMRTGKDVVRAERHSH